MKSIRPKPREKWIFVDKKGREYEASNRVVCGCRQISVYEMWKRKQIYDVLRVFFREGILDVKIGGRFAPVCQEPTGNEHEEKMIGLVFNLEGKLRCALTSKLTSDDLPEYGKRSGPRELYCDGRLGVQRLDTFFPTRQD